MKTTDKKNIKDKKNTVNCESATGKVSSSISSCTAEASSSDMRLIIEARDIMLLNKSMSQIFLEDEPVSAASEETTDSEALSADVQEEPSAVLREYDESEFTGELPIYYDEDNLVLEFVDPQTAFLYWSISLQERCRIRMGWGGHLVLRLYNITRGYRNEFWFPEDVSSTYLALDEPGCVYRAELGFYGSARYSCLAISNAVTTPADRPSEEPVQRVEDPVYIEEPSKTARAEKTKKSKIAIPSAEEILVSGYSFSDSDPDPDSESKPHYKNSYGPEYFEESVIDREVKATSSKIHPSENKRKGKKAPEGDSTKKEAVGPDFFVSPNLKNNSSSGNF